MLVAVSGGCARQQFTHQAGPTREERLVALPPLPAARVLPADRGGVSPPDTVVRFPAALGRTIVLRHAAPDNAVFAILEVPAQPDRDDTVRVALRATPGRYGITLESSPMLPAATTLSFVFAMHFLAPPEVPSPAYPTVNRYADWLAIAQVQESGMIRFLPTTRVASDLVRAPVSASGEYLVAAPVTPP